MKNMFIKAHELTRKIVKEYKVDYQAQFGLCLSYLLENKEEKEMKIETTKRINGKDIKFEAIIGEPEATEHKWWYEARVFANGEEITGKGNARPEMVWNPAEKRSVFCIAIDGEKAKRVAALHGKKTNKNIYLVFPGQVKIYEELKQKGENLRKQIIQDKVKTEEIEMNKLFQDENTVLKIRDHSSYGFSSYKYEKSTRGKEIFSKIKEINKKILAEALKPYVSGTDWGDYSITTLYEIPMKEFETIVEDSHKAAMEEKAAKEKAKNERINGLIEQAKTLGHKVEVARYAEPCDGSVNECSIDQIIEYIDENGNYSIKRIHTY